MAGTGGGDREGGDGGLGFCGDGAGSDLAVLACSAWLLVRSGEERHERRRDEGGERNYLRARGRREKGARG